jgi:hypothetical protein
LCYQHVVIFEKGNKNQVLKKSIASSILKIYKFVTEVKMADKLERERFNELSKRVQNLRGYL